MGQSLKERNRPLLVVFFIANAVLLLSLIGGQAYFDSIEISDVASPKSLMFGVVLISVFIIEALVSRDVKATLVFWRITNPWPASEAFSKHVHDDVRIDVPSLEVKLGPFPVGAEEQNRVWYRLFRQRDHEETVRNVHREFLLLRDLCVIAFLFVPVCVVAMLLYGVSTLSIFLGAAAYLVEYLLIRVAAKRRGVEFVQTVLAVEAVR